MTQTHTVKVAIVEDLREIREGLGQLISATPGFRCTGMYASMEDALDKIPHNVPDVVLSDIGLPGLDGISGIKILKAQHPELLILMLTVYDDNERIFDALCAGACGYLLKKTPWPKLVEALKEAVEGGSPMSPEVARRVINLFREIKPPKEADYELTPHETRLLRMLVEGHSYKTAAAELHVSVNTIKFHLRT
jgi:DNA-binding NarL/FixJ family response regulator